MILFLSPPTGLTYSGEYGETEHQTGAEGPDPVALKNMITITITITTTITKTITISISLATSNKQQATSN